MKIAIILLIFVAIVTLSSCSVQDENKASIIDTSISCAKNKVENNVHSQPTDYYETSKTTFCNEVNENVENEKYRFPFELSNNELYSVLYEKYELWRF